jgi:hypothetical protein
MAIPIELAVEDRLSEEVLRKILKSTDKCYQVGRCHCGGGFGYLKKNIHGFNNAAKGMPFLVLADLDDDECAPTKIQAWLSVPRHHNLIFRIAIREVESWILADRVGFSKFIGVRRDLIPREADSIDDPKRFLVELARRSRKRTLREDLVPREGGTATQGPAYNERLAIFVRGDWNPRRAVPGSPSLERTMRAIDSFVPQWDEHHQISRS